ncbi:MAG: hypothetical protein HQM10_19935 [Candidatus Riflebacteria bacterium]|nr:hypothetical protein [Candidatus Riflebacteria bacterium]
MLRTTVWVLILGLALVFPGTSIATTLTHSAGQIEIAVPDNWKSSQEGDIIKIEAPGSDMMLVFRIEEGDKADKVFEAIDTALESKVGSITWDNDGNYKEVDLNGMNAYEYNGSADAGKLLIYCLWIDSPSDKSVLLYWLSDEAADSKYEKEVAAILSGIKPLKK